MIDDVCLAGFRDGDDPVRATRDEGNDSSPEADGPHLARVGRLEPRDVCERDDVGCVRPQGRGQRDRVQHVDAAARRERTEQRHL
jgi:hypothetical protein